MNRSDLATRHEPMTDLFTAATTAEDVARHGLDREQVALFREQGYLPGTRVLNDEQLRTLRSELEEFFAAAHAGSDLWYEYHSNESSDPDSVLFHALGAWRLRPGFHDLLWNPAITVPASQLLDGAVRFWHDQLFCKPARHGGLVAWHQDYSYWTRTSPMAHLTCWIALDDSTVDNGCVHYIPGSHTWDLLPITGLADDMHAIRSVLNDEQRTRFDNPVAVELSAGECVFHHPLMVHGSFENHSDHKRRATVINVVRDGVCSQSDEPLLSGADVVPAGDTLAGRFYPLLFDPQPST